MLIKYCLIQLYDINNKKGNFEVIFLQYPVILYLEITNELNLSKEIVHDHFGM